MRVMLDTNCIDALLEDQEAYLELLNRKDIRLLITPIQIEELQAIPDEQKRSKLLEIVRFLCSTLATPHVGSERIHGETKHMHDKIILEASIRCDLLVSNDFGLLELAGIDGKRALVWRDFVEKFVFSDKKL